MKIYAKITCVMMLLVGNGVMGMEKDLSGNKESNSEFQINNVQGKKTLNQELEDTRQQSCIFEMKINLIKKKQFPVLEKKIFWWRAGQIAALGGLLCSLSVAVLSAKDLHKQNRLGRGAWFIPPILGSLGGYYLSHWNKSWFVRDLKNKRVELDVLDADKAAIDYKAELIGQAICKEALSMSNEKSQEEVKQTLLDDLDLELVNITDGTLNLKKSEAIIELQKALKNNKYNLQDFKTNSLKKKPSEKKKQTETENENEKQQQNTELIVIKEEKKQ